MKKLCIPRFNEQIPIDDPAFITIAIENRGLLTECLEYLSSEFTSLEEPFFEVDGFDKDIDECAVFIQAPILLDINTKKNVNALTKILKKTYFQEINASIEGIKESVNKAIDCIKMDFEVELEAYFDLKADDVLKVANIRFKEQQSGTLESFCRFIAVSKELNGTTIVFVSHLRDYFSPTEIEEIYNDLAYKGISIVNIESFENSKPLIFEEKIIIDDDQCVIKDL